METYSKCTSRLDAFSCGANGESHSNCSRVAIPASLLDGILGTYTTAVYSVLLEQVVSELPLLLEAGVGLMSIVVKSERDSGVVNKDNNVTLATVSVDLFWFGIV